MRCDKVTIFSPGTRCQKFQSLSGFLMRCDATLPPARRQSALFQSLSGFLMRCDCREEAAQVRDLEVSIPIGFSDAL